MLVQLELDAEGEDRRSLHGTPGQVGYARDDKEWGGAWVLNRSGMHERRAGMERACRGAVIAVICG